MCLPCGPRRNYRSYTRTGFISIEEYLEYLKKYKAGTSEYKPLTAHLQNVQNYSKIVSLYPELYPRLPQKYMNSPSIKAAAGIK